jgi:2'-5' RNA ligase
MPKDQPYCLWIIPEDDAYAITNGYIARLSAEYNFPRFEPHVTVLCGIHSPDKSKMRALAESISPFRIRLSSQPAYLDEYFRCLFLEAQETPGLMETFSKARDAFGYEGDPYYPHLSLAYGDFPIHTKREMIWKLGEISEIEFEARHLSLVHASGEMPISSWRVVERFYFKKIL